MSNLIPPLLSSSPPPIVGPLDEDDDDEFGDFRAAADSYDCDDISLPPSPQKSPEKELKPDFRVNLDINSNKSQKVKSATEMPTQDLNGSILNEEVDKDFQDRRKSSDGDAFKSSEIEVNCSNSQPVLETESSKTFDEQIMDKVVSEQNPEIGDQNGSDIFESDLQDGAPSPTNICDEDPHNNVKDDDGGQSLSNDENLFDAFSESLHEKTNSDDLSELNEIKSDDYIEEINYEITAGDNESEDKLDTSSKKINLSESPGSLNLGDPDPEFHSFGDFTNQFSDDGDKPEEASEDEFDDFVNPLPCSAQADDDFGDFASSGFADFSSQSCERPAFLDIDVNNAGDKSETILKEIFPPVEKEVDEFEHVDETKGNVIFDELKDVTETNALIYQWSKSNSQKMFFKALNIDTRNILYGPAWNCSMPRFAANLGLTPLEPMKSEILTPTPIQNISSPSNSSQKSNGDIPTAQFDWSGSGLINPLDSAPSEIPGNVPEDSSPQVPTDFLPTPEKPESILSLFDTETTESENVNIQLPKPSDDFSPFQSPKLIPLRETHISSEVNDLSKPGWLQPTILTPDLPRKETVMEPDDDEFDDFQMVLPEEHKEKAAEIKNDLNEFDMTSKVARTSHNHEHIFGIPINRGPIDSSVQKQPKDVNEDDEFTEFHSSVAPTEILKPLQPVRLEPLKPTVQYSTNVTQINWPDPGVTDEDIKNIELSYSRKNEVKGKDTKENSFEDEEWTDFVSVTNPVKSVLPERTSTPDLPLSVLNLNHVQAPKQPIPVITPSGLVQTKLSSNMTLQPKSVVQTTVQPSLFRPPTTQFQPSIISHQFAANFFPGNSNTMAPPAKSQDDEDDWSDFVSSQPQVNGYQQKATVKASQANWTNATTNIIMNPTFQNYVPPQRKVSPMPARNAIPSISAMPDLDFIAPKNRTSKK